MIRFATHEIGIARGAVTMVSDFDTQGPMWTETGDRSHRQRVEFGDRFVAPPVVHLGVGMWDLDSDRNQRGDLQVENVTLTGFDTLFRTWGDTRIARMRVEWMAIGAVPDEQDFIL
ncbi:H-type lectin domain-containing protein [Paracoccus marcusii]|uniref:H-type lectin domain-containing protein n=1 Tax=Paracoccus marcusii TaxID=59779 RepID=UPI0024921E90|nr:H-type lectin domain-containing protein [Paracoccus marcusii]